MHNFCTLLLLFLHNFMTTEGKCKTMNFETKHEGIVLQNFVFKSAKVKDERHCRSLCFMDDRCLSFNYVPDVTTCELSESDHVIHPGNLVARPGAFYSPAKNDCKCTKTEVCRYNFATDTFRCKCNYNDDSSNCPPICETDENNCHQNAICTGKRSLVTCSCKPGYRGDGVTTCENIDECLTGTHKCSRDAICRNTIGSFECECKPGYQGDGYRCDDINECETNCKANAVCTNTPGSFVCTCNQGYSKQADGSCVDIDECATGVSVCHANANCANTVGSYQCQCKQGFTGSGLVCVDLDECVTNTHNCGSNTNCKNTVGSFTCACKAGFNEDISTGNCVDIDECSTGAAVCHANANCANTVGSYQCQCKQGYTGNGVLCVDLDECVTNTHNCGSNTNCKNTVGSFTCACKAGFKEDISTGNCVDIDECRTGQSNCVANAVCTNTHGSYSCACGAGFFGNATLCVDPVNITVTSGNDLRIILNVHGVSKEYDKKSDGINLLVLNMDGSLVYPDDPISGFNTRDDEDAKTELNTFIQKIPSNKIVVMGTHKRDHLPNTAAFDAIIASLRSIGSTKITFSQITNAVGWSLIGYKGGSKPWITEKVLTTAEEPISASINPLE